LPEELVGDIETERREKRRKRRERGDFFLFRVIFSGDVVRFKGERKGEREGERKGEKVT
jgi:hypothetical protein